MQSFLTQIQMSQNEQTALRDGPLNNSDEISLYEISNSVSSRDVLNLQVLNKLKNVPFMCSFFGTDLLYCHWWLYNQ